MNIEIPALDEEKLKEAAAKHALAGAITEIREYYEGYGSPYRKKIKEELEKQEFSFPISLPDVIAQINETLTAEVNRIAANAISFTFAPMVQKYLTRIDGDVKFSDFLKEYIAATNEQDRDEYSVSIEEEPRHGWLSIQLRCGTESIDLTLHKNHKECEEKSYKLLSTPRVSGRDEYSDFITVNRDGSFKVPFSKDALSNDFALFAARVMLSDSKIIMDVEEFDDDMFEEKCHC